jgi:hypothetical protein
VLAFTVAVHLKVATVATLSRRNGICGRWFHVQQLGMLTLACSTHAHREGHVPMRMQLRMQFPRCHPLATEHVAVGCVQRRTANESSVGGLECELQNNCM